MARRSRGGSPVIEAARSKRESLREAGELLAVETVDRTGLVITSFRLVVRVTVSFAELYTADRSLIALAFLAVKEPCLPAWTRVYSG